MTTWLPPDGGLTSEGMDTVMAGSWEPQAELSRLSYNNIPPFPQPPLPYAGTAIPAPGSGRTGDYHDIFSPIQPQSGPLSGHSQRPPGPFYHPSLVPPPGAPTAGFGGGFDGDFLGLSGPSPVAPFPLPPCPRAGFGFSTSSSLTGRDGPGPDLGPGLLAGAGLPPAPAPVLAPITSQPQPPTAPASDPSVSNFDFTTTFTPALNAGIAGNVAASQRNHPFSLSTAPSAPSFPASSTAVGASFSSYLHQTQPPLPQSLAAANGEDGFNFAELATADSSPPLSNFSSPLFSSVPLWTCGDSSGQASPQLPPPIPRTFASLHHAYPGLEAQTQSSISPEDQYGCAQHEDGHVGDIDDDNIDENGRIPVDSLLDAMPAASSRKRTRTAASLDEPAGPSNLKRSRSHSSRASVSARPTSSRTRKSTRGARPVLIPDSDDVFAVDDDDDQKLFDLTKDDNIPEELMAAPKEDSDNSTKLGAFECIICMDSATDLTVTHCGHMFCGQCLHQAMHAEVTKKICPMCRQKLELRPKTGAVKANAKTYFHLELKLRPSKKQGKQPVRR